MATQGHGRKAKQERALQALRAGNTRRDAIDYAGIAVDTFYRWLEDDQTFSDAVRLSEAAAVVGNVTLIAQAAKKDWRAAAWLLERHPRTKQDWKRIDELDVRKLSIDQLLALEAACAERAESPGDRAALAEGEREGAVAGADPILPGGSEAEAADLP